MPQKTGQALMSLRASEFCRGFRARSGLMLRLPRLIGHAVNALACLVFGNLQAPFGRRLLIPVREAIAAKTRKVHQLDFLDIGVLANMRVEPAEGRSVKLHLLPC